MEITIWIQDDTNVGIHQVGLQQRRRRQVGRSKGTLAILGYKSLKFERMKSKDSPQVWGGYFGRLHKQPAGMDALETALPKAN